MDKTIEETIEEWKNSSGVTTVDFIRYACNKIAKQAKENEKEKWIKAIENSACDIEEIRKKYLDSALKMSPGYLHENLDILLFKFEGEIAKQVYKKGVEAGRQAANKRWKRIHKLGKKLEDHINNSKE